MVYMIRTSLEDQRLFLFCSTNVNSSNNPHPNLPTPLLLSIPSCLVEVLFFPIIRPPMHLHGLCWMEMRSIQFFRDGMDRSVDRWIEGIETPVWRLSLQVSIEQRLHRRLVAVKCSAPLPDTKQDSQESFQTSPLLVRDYSLGCYPIML